MVFQSHYLQKKLYPMFFNVNPKHGNYFICLVHTHLNIHFKGHNISFLQHSYDYALPYNCSVRYRESRVSICIMILWGLCLGLYVPYEKYGTMSKYEQDHHNHQD